MYDYGCQGSSSWADILGFQAAREQAYVRAFYGELAYNAIAKYERERAEFQRMRWATENDRIDDVASQVRGR
jgi:hypothetical protein